MRTLAPYLVPSPTTQAVPGLAQVPFPAAAHQPAVPGMVPQPLTYAVPEAAPARSDDESRARGADEGQVAPTPAHAGQSKVDVCHADGQGDLHLITIADPALQAHEDHGDPSNQSGSINPLGPLLLGQTRAYSSGIYNIVQDLESVVLPWAVLDGDGVQVDQGGLYEQVGRPSFC